MPMRLVDRRARGISGISGPLVALPACGGAFLGQMLEVRGSDGVARRAQVLDLSGERILAQLFHSTQGLDAAEAVVRYFPESAHIRLSRGILGRAFTGAGEPADGLPAPIPEVERDIIGSPINPQGREKPADFIQTGIS